MYSGEREVQSKRKALAVLQDEINRILNAVRDLSILPSLIIKADKSEIKQTLERIKNTEDEVEALRRKITREILRHWRPYDAQREYFKLGIYHG